MKIIFTDLPKKILLITLVSFLFLMNGCIPAMDTSGQPPQDNLQKTKSPSNIVEFEPYNPTGFMDLLIPGELIWNREKSVALNTDSFNGGILQFNGRVEVTSLLEFFNNSMKNDGWTSVGSMKSKDVLLVFTKPQGSCMIKITEGGPIGKTVVDIYITKSN